MVTTLITTIRYPFVAGYDAYVVEFAFYLFILLQLINKTARHSHEGGNMLLNI